MTTIAVLLRAYDADPAPPDRWPFARAALALDCDVVFGGMVEGGRFCGHRPVPGGWERVTVRPDVALDRFPSQAEPEAYARLLEGLCGVPVLNPPPLTALLRDKLRTQLVLHDLGMPEVEANPRRFHSVLPGFCKPRFGSFGRGIFRTERAPEAWSEQPHLVQRAIEPPDGFAGVALRILVQRSAEGVVVNPPVARFHRTESVVNRAKGAEVAACEDLFPDAVARAVQLATEVMDRFPAAVELGVDAVLDPDARPHLIEVNSRPRGRLAALAALDPDRFGALHRDACVRPLRFLERHFAPKI